MFAPELKTELKTLRIEVDDFYQNGCFSINSPKLEYIDINSAGLSNYHLVNANSPVNASIVLRKIYSKHRVEDQLLYLLKHLAALLSQTTGNYLFLEIHDLSLQAWYLPFDFGNVKQMKLVLHDCYYWEVLAVLLTKSPFVDLALENRTKYDKRSLPQWEQPESAPVCLLRNLSTITIQGFRGHQPEMDVAHFYNRIPTTNDVDQTLATFDRAPGTFDRTPGVDDRTSGTVDQAPRVVDRTPRAVDWTPTTVDQTLKVVVL
ncbi:hypothetical protein ACLB2K_022975 [Fragaria x ananassa]